MLSRLAISLLAPATAVCALSLAACGGSSNTSSTAASLAGNGVKFAQCMRSHGVANFPDPSGSGGGFQFKITPGMNPQSPGFQAAQHACRQLLPGPVRNPHPSEKAKAGMLNFAKCLRGHGLSNIPDPTTNPPSLGSGNDVIGRGGVFLVLPTGTAQSPAFQQAATACGLGAGKPTRALAQ